MEWVSVKDKFPNEQYTSATYTVNCLITDGKVVSYGYYASYSKEWLMFLPNGENVVNDVTHWMELPEPPKEEKK